MEGSESFKQTIKKYLEDRIITDIILSEAYNKENKNIDDCCSFILNSVYNSNKNGFADDEIFGLAVHYFLEDDLNINNAISFGRVVVNHSVELTEDEKLEAKAAAIQKLENEFYNALRKKQTKGKKESDVKHKQMKLF